MEHEKCFITSGPVLYANIEDSEKTGSMPTHIACLFSSYNQANSSLAIQVFQASLN